MDDDRPDAAATGAGRTYSEVLDGPAIDPNPPTEEAQRLMDAISAEEAKQDAGVWEEPPPQERASTKAAREAVSRELAPLLERPNTSKRFGEYDTEEEARRRAGALRNAKSLVMRGQTGTIRVRIAEVEGKHRVYAKFIPKG